MTEKPDSILKVAPEEADRAAADLTTPEFLAWLDSMTDADIAAQIASSPDTAPELDDEWFEKGAVSNPDQEQLSDLK